MRRARRSSPLLRILAVAGCLCAATFPVAWPAWELTAPVDFGYLAPTERGWQVWISRDGAPARPVTSDPSDKVSLSAAAATGELLAVTREGMGLVLTPAGEVSETIDLGAGADDAALSPDGRTIVYSRVDPVAPGRPRDLWIVTRGSGPPAPLVRQSGHQRSPSFTPDGRSVVYVSDGSGGGQDVWLDAMDGSRQMQITVGGNLHLEPSAGAGGAVFVSSNRGGDYDIWRIETPGGGSRPIVSRKGYDGQPRVSPGGDRILFVSRADGRSAVWVADADGTGAEALTDGGTEVRQPIWLSATPSGDGRSAAPGPARGASRNSAAGGAGPDDGRIAFLRLTEGVWQPWSSRPDGSDMRQTASLHVDASRLSASADARWMLANGVDGTLHLIDLQKGSVGTVPVEPSGSTDAAISADGKKIVYSVNTLESIDSNDLWVVGVQGGRARKITHQEHLQHFPVWTPQGDIVYLSGRGGQTHDIWRVGADGTGPRLVLGEHRYNFEPAVSDRGEILFSSNQDGNYDIWLFEPATEALRRLTDDPSWDGQPAFSPDGGSIAFLSRRGGRGAIWILQRESGRLSALPMEGEIRMPVWHRTPAGEGARGSAGAGGPQ